MNERLSVPFLEHAELLRQLHSLVARGQGDSDEAAELREQMMASWEQLNEEEEDRVAFLSEDLYSLTEAPVPQQVFASDISLPAALISAYERKDWDVFLAQLRGISSLLASDRAAALRGHVWNELGDLATAQLFNSLSANLILRAAHEALSMTGTTRTQMSKDSTTRKDIIHTRRRIGAPLPSKQAA